MADSVASIEIWNETKSKPYLSKPKETDNKYRRGVLGCYTGDSKYPGAALMTTAAALATGIGMVRFLGSKKIGAQVIQFRPSVVLNPGPIDALLLGSGVSRNLFHQFKLSRLMKLDLPRVLDAGALYLAENSKGLNIITPHTGELAKLLDVPSADIEKNPIKFAQLAAAKFQLTVLLKGHKTVLANRTRIIQLPPAPTWLATAGTGDLLAGILGALLAINKEIVSDENLIELGATASLIHAEAALSASTGPLDINKMLEAISEVVTKLS